MFLRINENEWSVKDTVNFNFTRLPGHCDIYVDGSYFFPAARLNGGKDARYDVIADSYRNGLRDIKKIIDGSFTLIIIDKETKQLVALTDPYGLNRIYFAKQDDTLLIADNVKNILDCIGERISTKGLSEYLRFMDISSPMTIFEGVQCLEPGSILTHRPEEGLRVTDNQGDKVRHNGLYEKGMNEAVDELQDLLVQSIKERVHGRTGLFLSGGVDSSLLAALMQRTGKADDLTAYTVGFDNPELDESSIAAAVANHAGIAHRVLKFTIEEEFEAFHELLDKIEIPFADPALVPTMLALKRMSDDSIETVMEGTGADGAIGYMPSRYHRIILNYTARIPLPLRKTIAAGLSLIKDPAGIKSYFDFGDVQEKFIRWKGWREEDIIQLCGFEPDLSNTMFYRTFASYKDHGGYELYRKLMISMPDYRITESCKVFGFRPAFPFFDGSVRLFMESLPFHYRYAEGRNKVIYKKLLANHIPESIWDVPKHGFNYPFETLMEYRDYELLRTYLSPASLKLHNLFNLKTVNEYVDRFVEGDMSVKFKLWALIMFQAWFVKHHKLPK
jgi:asparagine synthase (glutamine-hydrolysing)